MAKRIESPSSINTFKQCPRKYYYQYIEKLQTLPSIHLVRGNIAHSVLEFFYDIDLSEYNENNYPQKLKEAIQTLLLHQWNQYKDKLDKLNLTSDKLKFYFEETMFMLMNWVNQFIVDLNNLMEKKNISFNDAFKRLTPIREEKYVSDNYSIRGFIDAIHHLEDEVHIVDYKTNSSFQIKSSIKLQLAIYSLLYHEKHGTLPSKVGIFFLRHKLKMMNVDQELLELAKREIELIHAHTSITENKEDYPCKQSPLCKWSSGQCDFYKNCQEN